MRKEPLLFYLLRLAFVALLCVFMGMLYWSSALLEQDMQNLQVQVAAISKKMDSLEVNKVFQPLEPALPLEQEVNRYADLSLPNLLHDDPFLTEELPKLLGPDFSIQGTFRRATVGRPDHLLPFTGWATVAEWYSRCVVSLTQLQFGKYETFAPFHAIRIEERGKGTSNPEFWIFLRKDAYWQPIRSSWFEGDVELAPQFSQKHLVTAHDYKFSLDAMMNPYNQEMGALVARNYLGDIKEIEVIDDFTFVVRWNTHEIDGVPKILYQAAFWTGGLTPLPSFVYKYFANGEKIVPDDSHPDTYKTSSLWAQNFSQHWAKNIIVSCGPWTFNGMNDKSIKLIRTPDFFDPYAALAEEIVIDFKGSPDLIWQDFKSNDLDSYGLQPDQQIELEQFFKSDAYKAQAEAGDSIDRLDYLARNYAWIGWNQKRPYFASKKVRQALAMAVDKQRIIDQYMHGMAIPINGTFYRYSSAYDTSIQPWPYAPLRASQMLAEEGWTDVNGEGILSKIIDGEKVYFRFSLTYYVKNPATKAICEYVSTALKEIGIACSLHGVDVADLSAEFEGKTFDAMFLTWTFGSPPDNPRQIWGSKGASEQGSSNVVGFANTEADQIIDRLDFESDPQARVALYHQFSKIIHEEAPYLFLFTPKIAYLYRSYLHNVFLPIERQDLVPGANIAEPDPSIFWLSKDIQ